MLLSASVVYPDAAPTETAPRRVVIVQVFDPNGVSQSKSRLLRIGRGFLAESYVLGGLLVLVDGSPQLRRPTFISE